METGEESTNNKVNYSEKKKTDTGFHFSELLPIIRYRKNYLILFTVMLVLGAVSRHFLYIPTYKASTKLLIQKAQDSPVRATLANLGLNGSDVPERFEEYLNYLASSEFFLSVAESVKFNENYHLLNLTSEGEVTIYKRKFWDLFFKKYARNINNATVAKPEPVLIPVEKLAGIIQGMTSTAREGIDTVGISVKSLDAFTSMLLANTVAEVFIKKITEQDYNEVIEVKKFVEAQLDRTTKKLKKSELNLVEFKKKKNIISIGSEQSAFTSRLNTLESNLENLRLKLNQNNILVTSYEKRLKEYDSKVLSNQATVVDTTPNEILSGLRNRLDSLRYKKALMKAQGYSDDSWQIKEVDAEIEKVAAQVKTSLGTGVTIETSFSTSPQEMREKLKSLKEENKGLNLKISTIKKSRDELLKTLDHLPKDEQTLITLSRDVELQFDLYSSLKKKLQEVQIQLVALQSHIRIIQRAGLPGATPRTTLAVKVAFALVIGFFLGTVVAFLLEAVDPTVKYISDLEEIELIALGSVPHVSGSKIRRSMDEQSYRPDLLVTKEKPESPESMAFKHIRAQLTHVKRNDSTPLQVVTITSPERSDGKSFLAANIGVSMAQLEKRTVIIDCDFRNPSLPWYFGYRRDSDGLTSLLSLKASLDEIIIKDWMPNLDIIPAGWIPDNPTELVSSEKFKILLNHLKSVYDYIIIDSSPAATVVDASVIAGMSDTVILASSYRKTRKDALLLTVKKILQISYKNIYAILNNVSDVGENSYYYYYYAQSPSETDLTQKSRRNVDVRDELQRFEDALYNEKKDKKTG